MGLGTGIGRKIYDVRKGWRLQRALKAVQSVADGPRRPHGLPGELIVSMTSFPARFAKLPYTIRGLLNQSIRPDRLILWIDHAHAEAVTPELSALRDEGLSIETTHDLGPATKLMPALNRYRRAFVVTADDDFYYPPDWLERLTKGYDPDRPAIMCHRAHLARTDGEGRMLPYNDWESSTRTTEARGPGTFLFPTGVGGVLYPPHSLHETVFDEAALMRLTPRADDVWFFWMARLAGTRQIRVPGHLPIVTWPGTQEVGLKHGNTARAGNDEQVRAMEAAFGLLGRTTP